jgi:translation initiation factor IF-3
LQPPKQEGPRTNNYITAKEVRVIDENGEMLGVLPTQDAIKRAEEVGLDLVEVSPNTEPPVCKIIDAGKLKYELQKKAKEAKKKQKVIVIKEIKLRPTIDKHDYEVKLRHIKEFIEEGDKVKITLKFKGREMAHIEIGDRLMKKLEEDVKENAKIESPSKMEGKQMIMVLAPLK